jgi:hypothetical protein
MTPANDTRVIRPLFLLDLAVARRRSMEVAAGSESWFSSVLTAFRFVLVMVHDRPTAHPFLLKGLGDTDKSHY